MEDLEDFLPYLVLVGGWVPFLYSRYLWKIPYEPIKTVDIDFGFGDIDFNGHETIAARIKKKNCGEHHLKMGHASPFVPIVQIEGGLKADVEFITAPETPETIKKTADWRGD